MKNLFFSDKTNTPRFCIFAVFFFCLFFITGCPANADGSDTAEYPFVADGRLCSFKTDGTNPLEIKKYSFRQGNKAFIQSAVCTSKKSGFILAWNRDTENLYHINSNNKIVSKTSLKAKTVYVGQNFVLAQSNIFAQNKGFSTTLYKINYSQKNRRIALSQVWTDFIDCFIADAFFTKDGICLAGATKDDSKHNVFYITKNGCHKCFSAPKNADFMRLIKPDSDTSDGFSKIYAFVSGQQKTAAAPIIYNFTLDNYMEETSPDAVINLTSDPKLPANFECFFGYGFTIPTSAVPAPASAVPEPVEGLVLPASVNGTISFITWNPSTKKIQSVVPDATGCLGALCQNHDGVYYIARDPLIPDSYYGISLFDGKSCKKIQKIN